MNNKEEGKRGEEEVVLNVPCPNCLRKMMLLPSNFPLYDVQCTACNFRAQVKTNNCKPKSVIFGAGWKIMEKVLKAGFLMPPLFVNFKWKEDCKARQEIRFYPFVPKNCLKHYKLSGKARRANYEMFRYEELDRIPYSVAWASKKR